MTVSSQANTAIYPGNGATTTFGFPFYVINEDDLSITLEDATTKEVVKTYTTGEFTLSGIGESEGSVTILGDPIPSGYRLVIERIVDYIQPLDLVNQSGFYPDAIERQLDLLVMMIQQLAERTGRALVAPRGEELGALPTKAERAGKALFFNANGDPITAIASGGDAALRSDLAAPDPNKGAALSSFTLSLLGAVSRTAAAKLADAISVKDFGAVGDGVTDDTAAIQAANNAAAALGCELFFPRGTYMAYGLLPSASWRGDGATIKNNQPNKASATNEFIDCTGKTGLTFTGLTFDGSVSADPDTWDSDTFNAFTGAVPFFVYNGTDLTFSHCTFKNSRRAGLHIGGSRRIRIDHCTMTHARGEYGDGIYINDSSYVWMTNSRVYDVTRIGIVTENKSHSCTFSNIDIEYGHDASRHYGGEQFNTGTWYENSGNIFTSKVRVRGFPDRGFVSTTGNVPALPTPYSWYEFNQCEVIGDINSPTLIGFSAASLTSLPNTVRYVQCQAWGCQQPFYGIGRQSGDNFSYIGCTAELIFNSSFAVAYMYNSSGSAVNPKFDYTDCKTAYRNYDADMLNSGSQNTADYGSFESVGMTVTITNAKNIDDAYPVCIKARHNPTTLNVYNTDCFIPNTGGNTAGGVKLTGCRLIGTSSIGGNAPVTLRGCEIPGTVIAVTSALVRLTDSRITGRFTVARNYAFLGIGVLISNCHFERDIAADDYVLRIREEATTGSQPMTIIRDCTFYNTNGTATSTEPFIWFDRSPTPRNFADIYSDDTVTYLVMANTTLGNPTGDTKVTLH